MYIRKSCFLQSDYPENSIGKEMKKVKFSYIEDISIKSDAKKLKYYQISKKLL